MAVRKINYCYMTVPNRPGQGAQVLGELRRENVNLLAYSGFPTRGGKAQLDFVAKSVTPIRRMARKNGWRVSDPKKGFLVQGADRPGAVLRHMKKLADQRINVTAADAVCAGSGRYGMLLWVKAKDYPRAVRALKAK
jgi:hypothetical protein